LVNLAYSKASATKVKLYEIDSVALKDTVRNDIELNSIFGTYIPAFNSSYDYLSELKINKGVGKPDEVSSFVEKHMNSGNVRLKEDGFKFLLYLFQVNRTMLSDCAYQVVRYAKKKTVCQDAIMCAVNIYYTRTDEKDFFDKVSKKFEDVSGRIDEAQSEEREKAKAKKKDAGDDDAPKKPRGKAASKKASNDDDDDDEEEAPKQKGKKKAVADDDEEPAKPKGKNSKKSTTDDDEEEAPKQKGKKKASADDDDDEQVKPKGKSGKKAVADDDDEEVHKPKGKNSKKQVDSDNE
jgi:hypothetical protein